MKADEELDEEINEPEVKRKKLNNVPTAKVIRACFL